MDESAPAGAGFLADVVREWEAAAQPAAQAGIRVVSMRTGIVLARQGGVLARMLPPFRLGLGSRLGSGRQQMSWIALADYLGAVQFLLARADIAGPVNLTAPHPVSNAEFTAALAAALSRPALLSVPAPALRLALGGVTSDLLSSARVLPRRLTEAGYQFQFPDLPAALAAELATPAASPAPPPRNRRPPGLTPPDAPAPGRPGPDHPGPDHPGPGCPGPGHPGPGHPGPGHPAPGHRRAGTCRGSRTRPIRR